MNIDRLGTKSLLPQTGATLRRGDAVGAERPVRRASAPAAPPPAAAPQQVTSTPQLQQVLSTEEVNALAQAFSAAASRTLASRAPATEGLYSLRGTALPPQQTGRTGGLLDLTA